MKRSQAAALLIGLVAAASIGLLAFMHAKNKDAQATAHHYVTLNWTASAGATSYNVYRGAMNGGPYNKIGTTTATSYQDDPVPGGSVFYYSVTAVKDGKESLYSVQAKAVVP